MTYAFLVAKGIYVNEDTVLRKKCTLCLLFEAKDMIS